jgi:hypothetical protein
MDEKSDQILNHIESQRDALGRNLDELEYKVKQTADWRTHFDNNPALMLGLALGGGIIVGAMVGGGGSPKRYRYRGSSSSSHWSGQTSYEGGSALAGASTLSSASGFEDEHRDENTATAQQRRRAVEALDQIKAALISFGIAKSKEFLAQALPGFEEHLDRANSPDARQHQQSERTGFDRSDKNPETNRPQSGNRFDTDRETVGVGSQSSSQSSYARTPSELGD